MVYSTFSELITRLLWFYMDGEYKFPGKRLQWKIFWWRIRELNFAFEISIRALVA